MKAAQISKPGEDFELVERDIPEPGAGQVRVKVEACGICHSDVLVKEGLWPGLQYPRVPGQVARRRSVQRAAQLGRAERRPGSRTRHWRIGTSRSPVRTADGIRDGGSWPREGQGTAGEETRCTSLH